MAKDFKYLSVYNYYKNMIAAGKIAGGDRLPSVRRCADEQGVSRTTVQTAYDCLCADGYIISKPQSGYFASDISSLAAAEKKIWFSGENRYKYDLASERADSDSFDFKLWQRYIKSALRQNDRLLTYGEPQGEYDLRCSICEYLKNSRRAVCSPENIVIGAGSQSLLSLLIPLLSDRKTVYFTNSSFAQGKTVFSDCGFTLTDSKDADICYITPSRLTRKGDVMKTAERFDFAKSAMAKNQLIIEDDYGSELSGAGRPTPCIQGICGGECVYISTFSKLLVPSIRISFMVLPQEMSKMYFERRNNYNQTASKIEQIALQKFIQDGHLNRQIRKIRRAYAEKSKSVQKMCQNILGDLAKVYPEDSGRYLRLCVTSTQSAEQIAAIAKRSGLLIQPILGGTASFIISYYGVSVQELTKALNILRDILTKDGKQ